MKMHKIIRMNDCVTPDVFQNTFNDLNPLKVDIELAKEILEIDKTD